MRMADTDGSRVLDFFEAVVFIHLQCKEMEAKKNQKAKARQAAIEYETPYSARNRSKK